MNELTVGQRMWLAGLYEGEGTIAFGGGRQVMVRIRMTDEDVIRHVHRLVGFGTVTTRDEGNGYKRSWAWSLGTNREAKVFVETIAPWLFSRRREQAAIVFDKYQEYIAAGPNRGYRKPVNHAEKVQVSGLQVPKTCAHGHAMLPDNYRVDRNNNGKPIVRCKTCRKEAAIKSQEKRKLLSN